MKWKILVKGRNTDKLPVLLKVYEDTDYITRQRAKFVFFLCITLLLTLLFLIVNRLIFHPLSNLSDLSHLSVLLPLIILFFLISGCFLILVKGYYELSAYLLPTLIMLVTWMIMFFEEATPLIRLDTIVNIYAALSMVPLLIGKRKLPLILYPAVNIIILFIFIAFYKTEYGLNGAETRDYLLDVSVTIAFMGIVGYNIYSINKNALDRAETDIRERKAAETALRASERKFREMTMLLPQTIYEADLKGMLTYINKAGTDMFGYTLEEVRKGLNVFDTIAEDDHERVKENLKKLMIDERTYGSNYTGRRKDGSTFPIQIYSSVIKERNVPVGLRGVIFDISDLMKAYEDLRKSDELFRTLVESSPVAITLADLNGKLVMANQMFYNETGLTPETAVGKCPWDLGITGNAEKEKILLEQLKEKGHVESFETDVRYKNNVRHDLYVYAAVVEINNQKVVLRFNINITEKKMLENQIREYNLKLEDLVKERTEELAMAMEEIKTANKELKDTNKELSIQREQLEIALNKLKETQEQLIQTEKMASLGILTAGVAHEINNPINYIYNGAMAIESYVNEHCPDHTAKLQPLFDAINTGIKRTTGIVSSLNKYSRKEEPSLSWCNVHEIIENCLTMLYNQYKQRINVFRKYADNIPDIMSSEGKLHQAFLNILTNAIQAIAEKGRIIIQTLVVKDSIEISFTDTGEGITEENLKYIFDPFFTTKDPGKGTGLGLSIAQRIINEHDGSVKCISQLGVGTKFIINLPIN